MLLEYLNDFRLPHVLGPAQGVLCLGQQLRLQPLFRPLGDVIVMMPPLAMEIDDLTTIVNALEIEIGSLESSRSD